ncbi:MAG: 50S ribosomal protein L9 [Alphaproteobacteria bacterium]|nr:50S ribosomal protein L9 [Alphaproteobacteria bacterium]MDE2513545.1 50S ribosomal protein L9 [Alphaproteobacteria bacterium]
MEVILLERVEKLGQMGQVVKVRPGFARNYLLPQKKALRATKENLAIFEKQRAQLEAANLVRRGDAEQVAQKLNGISVMIIRQAGESGQLYGSVTARDIAQAVTEAGFTIGKGQVTLDKAIKTLGLYPMRVRLHPEVTIQVTVNVAQSAEEAEMQAKGIDVTKRALEAQADDAAAAPAPAAEDVTPEAEAKPKKTKTKAKAADDEDEAEAKPAKAAKASKADKAEKAEKADKPKREKKKSAKE